MTRLRALALIPLLILAGLAAGLAVSARPGDPALHPPGLGEEAITIYLARNWLHASLAVPTADLRTHSEGPSAAALDDLPDADWVLLGWGDAKHFRERGHTMARRLSLIRSLAVTDNPAVILMDPHEGAPSPESLGLDMLRLSLSREGFARLVRRLDASFLTQGDGGPVRAGRGRNPGSQFFHSNERTGGAAYACNHWIADLLDAAGVPTTPFADAVTAGLALDLRLHAGAETVAGEPGAGLHPAHETPPVHSGRFDPASPEAGRLSGAAVFEDYRIALERGPELRAEPLGLVSAADPAPDGRSWAEVLDVPEDSLVALREILPPPDRGQADHGLCTGRPGAGLALGFRTDEGRRYEIAMAGLSHAWGPEGAEGPAGADPEICAVLHYSQP